MYSEQGGQKLLAHSRLCFTRNPTVRHSCDENTNLHRPTWCCSVVVVTPAWVQLNHPLSVFLLVSCHLNGITYFDCNCQIWPLHLLSGIVWDWWQLWLWILEVKGQSWEMKLRGRGAKGAVSTRFRSKLKLHALIQEGQEGPVLFVYVCVCVWVCSCSWQQRYDESRVAMGDCNGFTKGPSDRWEDQISTLKKPKGGMEAGWGKKTSSDEGEDKTSGWGGEVTHWKVGWINTAHVEAETWRRNERKMALRQGSCWFNCFFGLLLASIIQANHLQHRGATEHIH